MNCRALRDGKLDIPGVLFDSRELDPPSMTLQAEGRPDRGCHGDPRSCVGGVDEVTQVRGCPGRGAAYLIRAGFEPVEIRILRELDR